MAISYYPCAPDVFTRLIVLEGALQITEHVMPSIAHMVLSA